jgi:hypothetical protein
MSIDITGCRGNSWHEPAAADAYSCDQESLGLWIEWVFARRWEDFSSYPEAWFSSHPL